MSGARWRVIVALLCAGLGLASVAAAGNTKQVAKPKWAGTIPVARKQTGARLKQMAKITPQEAVRAALPAVPGSAGDKKVTETELEVKNGFLVYSVEIRVNGRKGEHEVIVDAGSGKVLAQQLEDDDDEDDDDDDEDDDDD